MRVVVENYVNNRWSWFQTETENPDLLYSQLSASHPEWKSIRISPFPEWFKRINHPTQEVMGDIVYRKSGNDVGSSFQPSIGTSRGENGGS